MPQPQYHYINPVVLFEAVGADLASFFELSKIFLKIGPPMLDLLKKAILADDFKEILYESHSLKGTTALIGATQLTLILQEIENLSRNGDTDIIVPYIPELTRLFAAVMQEVQASIEHFQGSAGYNQKST
ncbi:MAG: Hpt domain-containing protein [Oxalobacteraceae bacterium]